jgi:hypothetical protein
MSPNRQSFVAQPRAVPKLVDFPVEIISCGPATVVALCARGQNESDVLSALQPQGAGGSPRTPIQSACTSMWLGDLPYWKVELFAVMILNRLLTRDLKDGAPLNFTPKVTDRVRQPLSHFLLLIPALPVVFQVWSDEDTIIDGILFSP